MKKKILGLAVVAAIVLGRGWNISQSKSDIALADERGNRSGNFALILLILLSLVYCKEKKEEITLFPTPAKNSIDIKYSQLQLDTIVLNDEGVESSLIGFSGITHDKNIYFIDSRLCWYYVFDLNGNFKKRSLGSGQGPQETTIGRIATYCILDNLDLFLLGYNVDHYVYDKNFEK
ncbi:MAG: hypothetical protein LBT78_03055, partial [Tannerella sp.]|nr:hypothetical protein [Tannerella sp.]